MTNVKIGGKLIDNPRKKTRVAARLGDLLLSGEISEGMLPHFAYLMSAH